MLSMIYLVGLIIVSISIGFTYKNTDGWLTLGIGLISYSVIVGMLSYLNGRKG